ncbi:MAG: hypothetical protein AB7S99_04960 [Pseudodonghicola sp.]
MPTSEEIMARLASAEAVISFLEARVAHLEALSLPQPEHAGEEQLPADCQGSSVSHEY